MEIDVQLEWTDYLKAQRLHTRSHPLTRILLYAFAAGWICVAGLGVYATFQGNFQLQLPLFVLLAGGFYILFRRVIMPRQIRRIFFQQKELQAPFQMEISASGITSSNEYGHSHRPWSQFLKWREDEHLFLLYHSDVLFTILPKRFLEDPLAIRQLIAENEVPEYQGAWGRAVLLVLFILLAIAVVILQFWSAS